MRNQVLRLGILVWLVGSAAALHCNVCVSQVVIVLVMLMLTQILITAGWSGRLLCQQQESGGDRLRQWVLQDRVQQGNCGASHTQLLLR